MAADSACLVSGRAETEVSGKLQALRFLSEEKAEIHAHSESWGRGWRMNMGYECPLPCRSTGQKPSVIVPTAFKLYSCHVQCFPKPGTTLPSGSPSQPHFH